MPGCIFTTCLLSLFAAAPEVDVCDPWYAAYADEHATGDHVIALWSFDSETFAEDRSGRGHELALQDAQIHQQGRFGACLETFPGCLQGESGNQRVSLRFMQVQGAARTANSKRFKGSA